MIGFGGYARLALWSLLAWAFGAATFRDLRDVARDLTLQRAKYRQARRDVAVARAYGLMEKRRKHDLAPRRLNHR
jgi:hypothetical protein